MAYNHSSFLKIVDILQLIKSNVGHNSIKILSVGYPDFVVPCHLLRSSIYADVLKSSILNDNDAVLSWHKLKNNNYVAISLFKVLSQLFDLELHYCDIQEGTGSSDLLTNYLTIDLNLQCHSHHGYFDLILDSGTSEHCFNIGQVFRNYHNLLSPRGFLYQWSPFLSPNHGFYSINPTLYHDLDRVSVFKISFLNMFGFNSYRAYFRCQYKTLSFRRALKFRIWPWEFSFVILNEVLLQKEMENFVYPVQSKYINN